MKAHLIFAVLLLFAITTVGRTVTAPRPNRVYLPMRIVDGNDSTAVTSLRGAIIEATHRGGHQTIFLTGTNYHLNIQWGYNSWQMQMEVD